MKKLTFEHVVIALLVGIMLGAVVHELWPVRLLRPNQAHAQAYGGDLGHVVQELAGIRKALEGRCKP